MDQKRIDKLRERVAELRGQGGIHPDDLVSLVKAVGRTKANRGKHPTYIGGPSGTRPISIPHHSGTLKRFTAGSILDQIEQDLDLIEEAAKPKPPAKKHPNGGLQ